MNAIDTTKFRVGQRVNCGLHWAGMGTIVAIHGEQDAGSVRQLGGGVMVMGGRATMDVAFDNGSLSKQVPEGIVRGVQWTIYDEYVTTDEVIDAVQNCKLHAAKSKETEEAHDARRDEERAHYAADNPHLLKHADRPDWSHGRLAAENIRRELALKFPSVKFKVRSDHNSVGVHWTDGPTSKSVETITDKYEAGHFDGMDDCYHYNPDATWADVFGSPRYTNCHRRETVAGLREALRRAADETIVPDDWNENCWRMPDEDRGRIMQTWSETDLSDFHVEVVKVPKNPGPFWTPKGLLATDHHANWAREFRKEATVEAEAERLRGLGLNVEVVCSRRVANSRYIRLIPAEPTS